jgi:hypothetical protein
MFYLKKAGLSNTPHIINGSNEGLEAIPTKAEDKFVIKVTEVAEDHISDSEFNVEQLCSALFMS